MRGRRGRVGRVEDWRGTLWLPVTRSIDSVDLSNDLHQAARLGYSLRSIQRIPERDARRSCAARGRQQLARSQRLVHPKAASDSTRSLTIRLRKGMAVNLTVKIVGEVAARTCSCISGHVTQLTRIWPVGGHLSVGLLQNSGVRASIGPDSLPNVGCRFRKPIPWFPICGYPGARMATKQERQNTRFSS
jgi:hypothetical protein